MSAIPSHLTDISLRGSHVDEAEARVNSSKKLQLRRMKFNLEVLNALGPSTRRISVADIQEATEKAIDSIRVMQIDCALIGHYMRTKDDVPPGNQVEVMDSIEEPWNFGYDSFEEPQLVAAA